MDIALAPVCDGDTDVAILHALSIVRLADLCYAFPCFTLPHLLGHQILPILDAQHIALLVGNAFISLIIWLVFTLLLHIRLPLFCHVLHNLFNP